METLLDNITKIMNDVSDLNAERVMALLPKICEGSQVATGQNWRASIRWNSNHVEVFDNHGQAADQIYRYLNQELGTAIRQDWSHRIKDIRRAVEWAETVDYTEVLETIGAGPSFYPHDSNPWIDGDT